MHANSENRKFPFRALSLNAEFMHTCAGHEEECTSAMTGRTVHATRNERLLIGMTIYGDMFMSLARHHVTMERKDFQLQAVIRKLQSKNMYHPSIVCSEESEKYSHLRYVKEMTIVLFMLI